MHQLEMTSFGEMQIRSAQEIEAETGQVVIAIEYCGVCGTDLHGISGTNGRRQPGHVMGHEAAGRIVSVGAGVDIPLETAVTFNPLLACGACEHCSAGEDQRCSARRVVGVDFGLHGAFGEKVVVPVSAVHVLPAGLQMRHGALIEPIAVALHALRVTGGVEGRRVLVLGGGPIGQSAALVAADFGAAEVTVSEPVEARRGICRLLGAVAVHPDALSAHLVGNLPDVVVDAVGISRSVQAGLDVLRPGGRLVLVGMGSPELELAAYAVTVGERSVMGSYCYNQSDFATAVEIADRNRDVLDLLISESASFWEAPQLFTRLLNSPPAPGKVLIRFDGAESPKVMS